MDTRSKIRMRSSTKVSKACQECRARKIRCSGSKPCLSCQQRLTPCDFRVITRRRKKTEDRIPGRETHDQGPGSTEAGEIRTTQPPPTQDPSWRPLVPPSSPPVIGGPAVRAANDDVQLSTHASVSATHNEPSSKSNMELFYGPTSDFSLINTIYREVSSRAAQGAPSESNIDDTGDVLDAIHYRQIFFGVPTAEKSRALCDYSSIQFLQCEVAQDLLSKYLSTYHHLAPVIPKSRYEEQLQCLFSSPSLVGSKIRKRETILLAIAIASLSTDHWRWGETLLQVVKRERRDDVNLESVQVDLLMICCPPRPFSTLPPYLVKKMLIAIHAIFENEMGRPNSAYIHVGSASRKAFAAGLHKEAARHRLHITKDELQERRVTFWSLFFQDIWISFYTGRPHSMSKPDFDIPLPDDPFLVHLTRLIPVMTETTERIYQSKPLSSMSYYRSAMAIYQDLKAVAASVHKEFGIELESSRNMSSHGPRETIMVTLYSHIKMILFRPFALLKGKLKYKRLMENATWPILSPMGNTTVQSTIPPNAPPWLDEAYTNALDAVRATIWHFAKVSCDDPLVKDLRYNCFFLEHAMILLVYDLLYDEDTAIQHLPWINASLGVLARMREGEPVSNTISAIRQMLRAIRPSYTKELTSSQAPKSSSTAYSGVELPSDQIPDISRAYGTRSAPLTQIASPFSNEPSSQGMINLGDPILLDNQSMPMYDFSLDEFWPSFDIDMFISQLPLQDDI